MNRQILIEPQELREMHRIQYERFIAAAKNSGGVIVYAPWGLGWLIKRNLRSHRFGLGKSTSARTFGHAGIDTVFSVGDPERDLAIAFITTDGPTPSGENTIRVRNRVTHFVLKVTV